MQSTSKLGEMLRLWRSVHRIDGKTAAKQVGIAHATYCRAELGKTLDVPNFLKLVAWLHKP